MSKKKVKIDEDLLQDALVPVDEQPFEIPSHWKWVRLGGFCELERGITFPATAKESQPDVNLLPCARTSNIQEDFIWDDLIYVDRSYIKKNQKKLVRENDILMSTANSLNLVGKVNILKDIPQELTFGGFLLCIRTLSELSPDFLFYVLRLYFKQGYFQKLAKQTTNIANLNGSIIESLPIPLPPLDEQKRIADKIEKMLDKINQSKQLIEEAKQTFELRRAAILEKAFSGELTKKWREENYSTVNDLLEQLELWKQKKIDLEIPSDLGYKLYYIPDNWKWIRLENLIDFTAYGTSTKTSDVSGVPVIRMGNINDGKIIMENFKYLPFDHPDVSKYTLEVNDILFNRTNSYELVGKSAIVNEFQAGKMTYASYLVNVRLHMKDVLSEYICQYINSHIGRGFLLSMVTQQVGQANINATKLASLMVPLPPITEIKYISNMLTKLKIKEEELHSRLDLETSIANITNSILQLAFQGQLKSS